MHAMHTMLLTYADLFVFAEPDGLATQDGNLS